MTKIRSTKPVTVSLPPQIVRKTDTIMRETGMTRSEVFRAALRRYVESHELQGLLRYGARQARQLGIRERDVQRIVAETRAAR